MPITSQFDKGTRLTKTEGFQTNDPTGLTDAVYFDGHQAIIDVHGASEASDALTVRQLSVTNVPTTLFQVLKDGTARLLGVVLAALTANNPTTSAVGDAAAVGTGTAAARDDHRHGREAFVTNSLALGTAAVAGVATAHLRPDDTIAAFDATAPTASAVGDAAATGAAARAARRDHVHGREAFTTPAIALGSAAAAGAATTHIRSDATIAAFDVTVPAAIGAAAVGVAAFAPRRDHVHATGAGTPTTQASGDAAATGTGPAAAMTDHRHGMPTTATISVVGFESTADKSGFTKQATVTAAATTTIDLSQGDWVPISMGVNITTLTLNNPVAGHVYLFELVQDATGGRTITWPATFKWPGGTAPTLSGANKTDLVEAPYNGTNYLVDSSLNH